MGRRLLQVPRCLCPAQRINPLWAEPAFPRRRFWWPLGASFGSQRAARGRVDSLVTVVAADPIARRRVAPQDFLADNTRGGVDGPLTRTRPRRACRLSKAISSLIVSAGRASPPSVICHNRPVRSTARTLFERAGAGSEPGCPDTAAAGLGRSVAVALRGVFASADGGLLLPQVRGSRVTCRRSLTKPYELIVSPCRPDWPPPKRCFLAGISRTRAEPSGGVRDADAVRSVPRV